MLLFACLCSRYHFAACGKHIKFLSEAAIAVVAPFILFASVSFHHITSSLSHWPFVGFSTLLLHLCWVPVLCVSVVVSESHPCMIKSLDKLFQRPTVY